MAATHHSGLCALKHFVAYVILFFCFNAGTCQDIGTQTSAQWNHSQFSANCIKPPGYYHDETPPAATPAHSMALPKRSTTDKKHKGNKMTKNYLLVGQKTN